MSINKGSYVITQFIQRLQDNICNNNNKAFLYEILSAIQDQLHDEGKQLMIKTFNNKTEFIKFAERPVAIGKIQSLYTNSFITENKPNEKITTGEPIDIDGMLQRSNINEEIYVKQTNTDDESDDGMTLEIVGVETGVMWWCNMRVERSNK